MLNRSEHSHFQRICYLGFSVIRLRKKHNLWKGLGVHLKGYDKDCALWWYAASQLESSRHVTNLLPYPTTLNKITTLHYITAPHACNQALLSATVEHLWIQLVQSSEDNLKKLKFKNYTVENCQSLTAYQYVIKTCSSNCCTTAISVLTFILRMKCSSKYQVLHITCKNSAELLFSGEFPLTYVSQFQCVVFKMESC